MPGLGFAVVFRQSDGTHGSSDPAHGGQAGISPDPAFGGCHFLLGETESAHARRLFPCGSMPAAGTSPADTEGGRSSGPMAAPNIYITETVGNSVQRDRLETPMGVGRCTTRIQPAANSREPPQPDRASTRLGTAYDLTRGRLPRSSSSRSTFTRPTFPDSLPTLSKYSYARPCVDCTTTYMDRVRCTWGQYGATGESLRLGSERRFISADPAGLQDGLFPPTR